MEDVGKQKRELSKKKGERIKRGKRKGGQYFRNPTNTSTPGRSRVEARGPEDVG